jgi:hypothetical protein
MAMPSSVQASGRSLTGIAFRKIQFLGEIPSPCFAEILRTAILVEPGVYINFVAISEGVFASGYITNLLSGPYVDAMLRARIVQPWQRSSIKMSAKSLGLQLRKSHPDL